MDEYIRREDAIKCIEGQCVDGKMWGNDDSEGTLIEAYSAIDDLMEIPPADVATVLHAKWGVNVGMNFFKERNCPVCKKRIESNFWNYCPNCGAKMDLEG